MKKIVCLILALLICSVSAFAEGLSVSFDSAIGFTVTGQAPENSKAMITVKKPGTADFSSTANFHYVDFAEYSADGFSFLIPAVQGVQVGGYNMRVTFENSSRMMYTEIIPQWRISDFAISDDGKSASVKIESGTGAEVSTPVLIVGVYEKESGKMVSAGIASEEAASDTVLTATAENLPEDFETNAESYVTKAFLWNSLLNLNPLKPSI